MICEPWKGNRQENSFSGALTVLDDGASVEQVGPKDCGICAILNVEETLAELGQPIVPPGTANENRAQLRQRAALIRE